MTDAKLAGRLLAVPGTLVGIERRISAKRRAQDAKVSLGADMLLAAVTGLFTELEHLFSFGPGQDRRKIAATTRGCRGAGSQPPS